jgi:putative CocE/NonD family hydrolase
VPADRGLGLRRVHRVRIIAGSLLAASVFLATGCFAVGSRLMRTPPGVRPVEHGVRVERAVTRARDGVALVSFVYRPQGVERAPTVLVRIPFQSAWINRMRAHALGRFWAGRGYAVVIQGTRGRFLSSGTHYPLRPEREDGIDTLAWIAAQDWYDGRIGSWGGSTFGYTQWVLADRRDPGPSCIDIQIASTSFREMLHPGGAFSLESALYWMLRIHGRRPELADLRPGFDGWPLVEADDRLGVDVPFFDDWLLHAERDAYWIEIDGDDRPARAQGPVLSMAGWYDAFLPTQLRDFVELRARARPDVARASRLVIGPWAHARTVRVPGSEETAPYRHEILARSIPWFDRHLRGEAPGEESAPVRIFVMGENAWRDEEGWPLARARETALWLRGGGAANGAAGDGRLERAAPTSDDPPDGYVHDPEDPVPSAGGSMLGPRGGIARQEAIERREDVLVYTGEPLAEPLEVTGPVTLVLWVRTSAPSSDFTGKLVDVHPDGAAYNVTDGILRRRYDPSATGPVEIRIELWPTSMLFRAGHRIRLEVSSSNFPRYDRNPSTGEPIPTATRTVPATQTVHHGATHPSRLLLPVVPRADRPDQKS